MYAADTTPEFEIGTVATHTCNAGFALVGFMTRTCMDDDQADIVGVWSGSAPTCERNYYLFIVHFKEKCYFLCLQRSNPLITLQKSSVPP